MLGLSWVVRDVLPEDWSKWAYFLRSILLLEVC
jgi:hypothetical protein